ncbi:MAG: hypothetical protein KGI06_04970 [Candidatus Micrarchaeota archaeon]|nr:hypothetical protein [Candidatus Micrarchaeota archaeon]
MISDAKERHQYAASSARAISNILRRDDGVIEKIKDTTSAIWDNMFSPHSTETSVDTSREALRGIFDVFVKSDLNYVNYSWIFNLDLRMNRSMIRGPEGSLERLVRQVPDGYHVVIPIMTTGIVGGAAVQQYLGKRSAGFAFVGFSNSMHYINGFKGKLLISSHDREFLRRSSSKSAIVVDNYQEEGNSMRPVIRQLRRFGFEKDKIRIITEG